MHFRKRYRVVRDARGQWGVLDGKWGPESGRKRVFAPYGAFAPYGYQDVAFRGARMLNEGSLERAALFWKEFHPLPHHL